MPYKKTKDIIINGEQTSRSMQNNTAIPQTLTVKLELAVRRSTVQAKSAKSLKSGK